VILIIAGIYDRRRERLKGSPLRFSGKAINLKTRQSSLVDGLPFSADIPPVKMLSRKNCCQKFKFDVIPNQVCDMPHEVL
jgi:hypothetical protein